MLITSQLKTFPTDWNRVLKLAEKLTTSDPKLVIAHSAGGGGGTPPSVSVIQDLTYTYDNNGNITQIVDASDTDTSKTATYTYDDLNRLITAGITNASSGVSYTHTYNYDAIGNITTSTPAGIYVYGSSTYANPHAATAVSSTIYSYDNNGNLTSDSTWTHTWDFRNRLTQSTKTGATSTYAYDHTTSRVKLVTASSTTIIPSANYSVEGGTAVKYISANGMLLATIRGTGASSSLYAMHSDHLGNVEKTTNASGSIVEISDYYPYGSLRNNTQYSGFNDRKGFIGKDYDSDTGLTQADARYYAGSVARFISQDSAFWQLPKDILSDPQQLNSYGYARSNPTTYKDADGKRVELVGRYVQGLAGVGIHTFILITPDAANNNSLRHLGLGDQAKTTIGAYNTGPGLMGNLIKGLDYPSDYKLDPSEYVGRITINKPDQYESQAEFEKELFKDNAYAPQDLGAYSIFWGNPNNNGGQVISNNYPSNLLMNAGVPKGEINSIRNAFPPSNFFGAPYAPGVGIGLSSQGASSLMDMLNSLKSTLIALQGLIQSNEKK